MIDVSSQQHDDDSLVFQQRPKQQQQQQQKEQHQQIIFISFGTRQHQRYQDALQRIRYQAQQLQLFTAIYSFTDEDLQNDDVFWNQHGMCGWMYSSIHVILCM